MLTFSPGMLWGYIGSMGMLGYEETKSPTSSQEMVLLKSLLDLSHPCGFLAECKKKDKMLVA